jgi:hypothetical protein
MNKSLTTEEAVIVSCLAVGWALVTIARELIVPLAALALTLLGWRPKRSAGLDTCAELAPSVPREDAAPEPAPPVPNNWLDTTTPKRTILQATPLAQLRSLATARGMDPADLSKPALIEAILDHIDDAANGGNTEALTPEQRSPSLRGRRR